MKKALTVFIALALLSLLGAAVRRSPQDAYIEKWSGVAVREMYRSGVPASITLAQGILESGSGLSKLSRESNNHFGIKCHKTWKGRSVRADDDKKNECFRAYDTAEESFRDHSDFLRYQDRYKFLFELEITDYKGWARGLKKAGYATDPGYADKLIKIIEEYRLYEYDRFALDTDDAASKPEPSSPKADKGKDRKEKSKEKKASRHAKETIPSPPRILEEPKPASPSFREQYNFPLSRKMFTRNGIPFIVSTEGESYSSIASSHKLFLKELLRFNDLASEEELLPGTTVYLQAKKKYAPKGLDKYIVGEDEEGLTLRDVCQRFGVRQSMIMKINGFDSSYVPQEGDEILLRPAPRSKRGKR